MADIDNPSQHSTSEASYRSRILLHTAPGSQYQSEYVSWHKLDTQEITSVITKDVQKCWIQLKENRTCLSYSYQKQMKISAFTVCQRPAMSSALAGLK